MFFQHTLTMNDKYVGKERRLYLMSNDQRTVKLADSIGEIKLKGKISVDSQNEAEYVAFNVDDDDAFNDFSFIDLGLREGDIIRAHYYYDTQGELQYDEYVIEDVINASSVRLKIAVGKVQTDDITQTFEVWRNQTNREYSRKIAEVSGYQSELLLYIKSDNAQPGYSPLSGAAYLVGLIGAVVPHQGVTWYPFDGFSADEWIGEFSSDDLNFMAGNGVSLITRHSDGYVCVRHAVTANKYPVAGKAISDLDLKLCEEMYGRNALLCKKEFREVFRNGYIGVTNVTDSTLDSLAVALHRVADYLAISQDVPNLGGRIEKDSFHILQLRRNEVLRDEVICEIECRGPFPMNRLEATLYM
jgi:hypothetical protein